MKTSIFLVVIGIASILTSFGNGCAKTSFQTLSDVGTASRASVASCSSDESNLSSLSPLQMRTGYMGKTEVLYADRGDGWIQVDSDKLYLSKSGVLPTRPETDVRGKGLFGGVGITTADRWPGGVIPYAIDPTMPSQERITAAVNHWNTNLAGVIHFIPRTTETDYVYFQNAASGCAAPVGYYAGEGVHPVDIADQCGSGNVAHEMGHVVGLDHEQNRLDRDSFIAINWSKITSGYSQNFNITPGNVNYLGYDFGSIMHYTLTAFSTDGSQTISPIVAVPSGVTVGQRSGLSSSDINSVRQIYGAATIDTTTTTTTTTTTSNSGLFGHYYEGIDFRNLRHEQIDPVINFTWPGSPTTDVSADYFSVRWKGWVVPPTSGTYNLKVAGQDAFRLILNGSTLVDNLAGTGYSQISSASIPLTAGQYYPIVLEFKGLAGAASVQLLWSRDGGSEVPIPTDRFVPNMNSAVTDVCTGG